MQDGTGCGRYCLSFFIPLLFGCRERGGIVLDRRESYFVKQDVYKVATRYARSLLQVTEAQKVTENVLGELTFFVENIRSHDDLVRVMHCPVVSSQEKVSIFTALGEKVKLSPLSINFIKTLCAHGRLAMMADVVSVFSRLFDRVRGVCHVRVVSAVDLSDKRKKEMEALLATKAKGELKLSYHIDEDVIGGFVIDVDGVIYDASLKTELMKLKQTMKG